MCGAERIHVVAAALRDTRGRVLVTRRASDAHQGGLLEFPGGKRRRAEQPIEALRRELAEELGISVTRARPLVQVPHDYDDRSLLLDVWLVDQWQGTAHGREGQPLMWQALSALRASDFPAADAPIISALRLPECYMITAEPAETPYRGLRRLHEQLKRGVRLVQLRSKVLNEKELRPLTRQMASLCKSYGGQLLVNADPAFACSTEADGVHLDSTRLMCASTRPLDRYHLVAASCHNADELAHACAIGVDFAVLSPIHPTPAHPDAVPLGWDGFRSLACSATVPVYALGGVGSDDLSVAWQHGAQGIAAVRAFADP